MSKRGVVALSVIAALLIAYVVAFERGSVTSKELGERKSRVLVSFVRDKVEKLEVERRGTRVVLERKPAKEGELRSFELLAPVRAAADQDVVDQLLGELEWLSARRTLEPLLAEDEKRFGLAAPRYRVAFTIGRERHVLEVGNEDVHGESVYVRLDRAARAYVVPKSLLDVLDREPLAYRDKQLLAELTIAWARKLTVAQPTTKVELTKDGDRWWLEASPRGYADGRRVEQLLHALAELRAVRYVEPAAAARADKALADVALRIDVSVVPDETREDKTPKLLGIQVGGSCEGHANERYARALPNGAAVCIREDDLKALSASEAELRELRLVMAETSAIERVQLARAGVSNSLQRKGESWQMQGASAIDREAVEVWLRDLAAARALRVLPPTPFQERGQLKLELAGGAHETISFGDLDAQGELAVKRGEEPLSLRFPASVYDLLLPSSTRFSSLEVWAAHQPSQVQRIDARDRERTRVLVLENGTWRAAGDARDAGVVDSERTRDLVRTLVDLRARAFISEQARPVHGIGSVGTRIELGLGEGAPLSLELGAQTSAGAYARVDGKRVVEIESALIGVLRELAGGPRAVVGGEPGNPTAPAAAEHDEHADHGDHEDHAH